ncbi:thiamine pyrophosphate-dependent enzyme [Thalassotalea atypica]|uniref:thiamine pyrophosphate-dependent enzyme n=1 Tax=Thalassotalea atypica TaxID=2054316 RepID=UPI002573911C|nr:thiamine pyrophosphate-dependent enzyme [Thalassotalea atypica]
MTHSYEMNLGSSYNEALPTLGEVMVQVIKFFGEEKLYGVGGDFAANIIAALDTDLNIYPSSNEMHAGFSACAQAEMNGIGFCLTTYTVGSLPCTSAAALAITESLPVIFISGAPAESEIGDIAIHHTVHPNNSWKANYDNALNAFSGLGMKVERLQGDRTEGYPNIAGRQFYQLVKEAYQTKQPIFIEIPRDQLSRKTQPIELPPSPEQTCCGQSVISGYPAILDNVLTKLNECEHPVLYIGDRLKHNTKLKQLVLELSHRFNIPYATSWFAKGLFDEYDPLCLGSYNGIFSPVDVRQYIETKMDYLLDIANSLYSQDSNTAFATGTHKIENFANKTSLKGAEPLESDVIEIMEGLITHHQKCFEFTPISTKTHIALSENIDFNNLAQTLNELQKLDDKSYIYLPEIGNSYFASYSLKTRKSELNRSWLTNPWYGAMGTSLPYARVVAQEIKHSQLNCRAVVITGDGGFHFQLNELIHFLKDGTDVTIIYMRNNVFHLGKSGDSEIYHCNDKHFDAHHIIKAYQGHSETVTSVDEFNGAFKASLNRQGINLIEVLAIPIESKCSNEIKLLNLYIKAKNGQTEAIREWDTIAKL